MTCTRRQNRRHTELKYKLVGDAGGSERERERRGFIMFALMWALKGLQSAARHRDSSGRLWEGGRVIKAAPRAPLTTSPTTTRRNLKPTTKRQLKVRPAHCANKSRKFDKRNELTGLFARRIHQFNRLRSLNVCRRYWSADCRHVWLAVIRLRNVTHSFSCNNRARAHCCHNNDLALQQYNVIMWSTMNLKTVFIRNFIKTETMKRV